MQCQRSWRVRWLVSATALTLVATVLGGTQMATPAAAYTPEIAADMSAPAGKPPAALPRAFDAAAAATVTKTPAVQWPIPGTNVLSRGSVRANLETLDHSAAREAGLDGVLMRLARQDSGRLAAKIPLEVDYSSFRHAFGGDYASRLTLVRMPQCALSTPDRAECRGTVVASRNDLTTGRISAEVTVEPAVRSRGGLQAGVEPSQAAESQLFAVTAASSGSASDFAATSLSPSSTWSVGLQSGEFAWSYPIGLPAMPGGSPEVGLSYSSGSADGRTAATNNQVSWIGEGFDYQPGYIERRYQSCDQDGQPGSGDQCWASHNAVLNLPGEGGELVRDDATGVWRSERDDSYKAELLTGASNGDDDGEHWLVTSGSGTKYYFGSRSVANSAWTVPVFGDDTDEPCHRSTFDTSWCQQAYRWSLDYVVDRHGDVISYYYDVETNAYGRNGSPSAATPYVRGGQIARIEYGLREPLGTASARVVFTSAPRCIPGSACDLAQPANFPDVPLDRQCDGTSCSASSPTFFTTKRLARIATQVHTGGVYRDVDSWTFQHLFPATGDGESPTLWLESITPEGHPSINFDGVQLRNRVADGNYVPMWKWRVNRINNGTGGQTELTFGSAQCAVAQPAQNDQRCYPAYWSPPGSSAPILEYFHKYVVTEVKEVDRVGGNPAVVTQYEYDGGPAWHYDDAELVEENRKTYGQLRGFQKIRVRTGEPASANQTLTEHLFLRGMDGDRLPDGARRAVTVADSRGGSIADTAVLRGFARETRVFNGVGGAWVSTTINEPWVLGPTSRRVRSAGPLEAYKTDVKTTKVWTALSDGGIAVTEEQQVFDNFGRISEVNDLGDVTTPEDDTCSRHTYAENQDLWIIDTISRFETVGVACTVTAGPADVLAENRLYYDGSEVHGTPPMVGNPTKGEELTSIVDGVRSYATTGRATFDTHGRVLERRDPSGDAMAFSFIPALGGPVISTTVTDVLGHPVVRDYDPVNGALLSIVDANGRRSEFSHDTLGRLTAGWKPGRVKGTDSADVMYEYLVRDSDVSVVTTRTLLGNGSYHVSHQLLDGLLRSRQVQSPSPAGGRIVTDTFYDGHGRVVKSNDPYHNATAPGTTLLSVADTAVNGQTKFVFDGAGRETAEIFLGSAAEKWRTTTSYGGNWIAVQPPAGGIATMEVFNAGGEQVELRQFRGGTPAGAYDATRYTYTKTGQPATVTDQTGNVWRHHYDLRGREIRTEDPDKGVSTSTYDDEDRMLSTTDARGRTLSYAYDVAGRKTGLFEGSTQLASWEFDTLPGGKGLPTASNRYAGGNAYRIEVLGYGAATGRPTGTAIVIPAGEGALAGRYEFTAGYNLIGQVTSTGMPAVGGLPAETLLTAYNQVGLPTTHSSSLQTYGALAYDNLASINLITLGNPGKYTYQSYTRDKASRRLTRSVASRQGVSPYVIADANYTYDNAGNISKIADTPASQPALSDVQCFQYDYLRRLTEAWASTNNCTGAPVQSSVGGAAPYWQSFTYDAVGNRLSEVQHKSGGDVVRSYDVTGHKLNSVGSDTFGYDADGNMTNRTVGGVTQTLTWDGEGHLAANSSSSYVYDADGNRLLRKDPGATTLYLGPTELKLTGTVVTGTRYYSHGGSVVAVRSGSDLVWLINNHQGTSGYAVNAATMAVTRRYSLPFGGSRGTAPGAWIGERGFVGGTNDGATGLIHLGAREYDPAIGRFISVDPVIDTDDPQQMHGYAYSDNSPITKSDPDGLKPECGTGKGCDKFNKQNTWNGKKYVKNPKPKPTVKNPNYGKTWTRGDQCRNSKAPGCNQKPPPPRPKPNKAKLNKENNCKTHNGCGPAGTKPEASCASAGRLAMACMRDGLPDAGGGGLIGRLPRGGSFPFEPKKGQSLDRPGSIGREGRDPVDKYGDRWQWDKVKQEWDVQTGKTNSKHTNVGTDGEITHKGKGNTQENNTGRQPKPKPAEDSGTSNSVRVDPGQVAGGVLIVVIVGIACIFTFGACTATA